MLERLLASAPATGLAASTDDAAVVTAVSATGVFALRNAGNGERSPGGRGRGGAQADRQGSPHWRHSMGPVATPGLVGRRPADLAVSRESVRLAFSTAFEHLPPRQVAVSSLFDEFRLGPASELVAAWVDRVMYGGPQG